MNDDIFLLGVFLIFSSFLTVLLCRNNYIPFSFLFVVSIIMVFLGYYRRTEKYDNPGYYPGLSWVL